MADARRIDHLLCGQDTATERVQTIIAEVKDRAAKARADVRAAIGERKDALDAREAELMRQIDELKMSKIDALNEQLVAIEQGLCPPAPPEDPDMEPDPGVFLLDADCVINFRIGDEEDFVDKVADFGKIGDSSTYASFSYAQGPAMGTVKAERPTYLWVYSCDRFGQRRTEGGDKIVATLSHPECFEELEVEDLKDGRYKVKFIPKVPGEFDLLVALSSEDDNVEAIRGSPFRLHVQTPEGKIDYAALAHNSDVKGRGLFKRLGEIGCAHTEDKLGAIHHPTGVDFDPSGRYAFVVDQSNHRLQVFDMETEQAVHEFGGKGFLPHQFQMPANVVVDRDSRLYVTDLLNHRVQVLGYAFQRGSELEEKQIVLTNLYSFGDRGEAKGQFQFPKGMAITDNGQLLVCDSGNHRVQVFDMTTFEFQCAFGTHGLLEGQFDTPLDAAVNFQGEILVADATNRIQVFDSQYNYVRSFGSTGSGQVQFSYPVGISIDDEYGLFVCDHNNHRIHVIHASTGEFLCKWKGGKPKPEAAPPADEDPPGDGDEGQPGEPAEAWSGVHSPWGIAVNIHGTVLVTDYQQGFVYMFKSDWSEV